MFHLYHHELYAAPDGQLRFRNDGSRAGSLPPAGMGLVVRAALLAPVREPLETRCGRAMARIGAQGIALEDYIRGASQETTLDALMSSGLSYRQAQGWLSF